MIKIQENKMTILSRQTAGIKQAKAHLGRYLDLAMQGTEVIITRHGRPVGKIVPCHDDELNLQERLSRLESSGVIKKRSTVSGISPKPVYLEGVDIQQMLQQDRNKSDANE